MTTIDSHQHFWQFDPVRDAWIDDTMPQLRRDFLPEDLKPILHQNGIDGCIAVQADQSVAENTFLLSLADKHSFIKGVVGWVDLRAENIADQLAAYDAEKKMVGFRHIAQAEPDDFFLQPDVQRGIQALSETRFTFDILVYPQQLPAAIALAEAFPMQEFVIDHLAKPRIKIGATEPWEQDIRQLAALTNVYCKVSGMVTEADWTYWNQDEIAPYLDVVTNAFGTKRLLFGSDWPVCELAAHYEQVKGIIDEYYYNFTKTEKADIMGENAMRFYGLTAA